MKYKGKLYGKVDGKFVVLEETSEIFDDMYEALKAVLEDVQFIIEHGYIGDVMDDITYVKARAALAKADGTL